MILDPHLLEKEAHEALAQEKYEEAYRLFKKAAEGHHKNANYRQAALCFASSASCWAIKSGEKTFSNAAHSYEEAAKEAEKIRAFGYASMLYKHAAICYERDMEFMNFSDCFYRSREAWRRFVFLSLINPKKMQHLPSAYLPANPLAKLFMWLGLILSSLVWGYGERPFRTLFFGLLLIFGSAFLYMHGSLFHASGVFKPTFPESFYFSSVTFTTVGYGDITPLGFNKIIAMAEAFAGVFLISIFTIGLSRKYLRI